MYPKTFQGMMRETPILPVLLNHLKKSRVSRVSYTQSHIKELPVKVLLHKIKSGNNPTSQLYYLSCQLFLKESLTTEESLLALALSRIINLIHPTIKILYDAMKLPESDHEDQFDGGFKL